jgi:hypothetical protein
MLHSSQTLYIFCAAQKRNTIPEQTTLRYCLRSLRLRSFSGRRAVSVRRIYYI